MAVILHAASAPDARPLRVQGCILSPIIHDVMLDPVLNLIQYYFSI
jgi:hypothetical protein